MYKRLHAHLYGVPPERKALYSIIMGSLILFAITEIFL